MNYSDQQTRVFSEPVTPDNRLDVTKLRISILTRHLGQLCTDATAAEWVIISAVAFLFVLAGFFFRQLTSAFFCSAIGTILIFAGMILLLFYKGAEPVSNIRDRPAFFAAVFCTMTAFGAAEQLLLFCRGDKKKAVKEKSDKPEPTGDGKEPPGWRIK